jgi:xanthine dehydrogenase large subunit
MAVIGKDIPHDSAHGHVAGESVFIDDMPPARGELLVEVVGSPVAHGKIRAVDVSQASKSPGIACALTAADIPGHNLFGPIIKDEHLLASDEAVFLGDPIVILAAHAREQLRAAGKLVQMEVEQRPPIFSIDEAIAAQSFIGAKRVIARGDSSAALAAAPHQLQGEFEVGGQEHFYLESHAAIAIPMEHGQVMIHSSTQHPSEVQSLVAEIIGVPFNHVTIVCKRMGGAFGGKETQAAQPAAIAALVAMKTGHPARVVYNKDDDMRFTGKRHPFKCWYRVGFDDQGRILALEIDHFSNGGCSADLSPSVLERAMLHTDNAYFLPHVRITGQVCRTNLPSNTAFRGFGGPRGVASMENIIQDIAVTLGRDAADIRRINCYGVESNNTAPYGQLIQNNTLPQILDQLIASSDYKKRRTEIDAFNASSTTHLRGLALTPVKFGISFTKKTLNQANALVNIYTDGTVLVSTGATEMGQGVNTRVRQIVADELGVKYDDVLVGPTSTDKNNNTSPTAASSGTDLNGAAARDACVRLRNRLADFLSWKVFKDNPAGLSPSPESIVFRDGSVWDTRAPGHVISFRQAVCEAYIERISLGERGFYVTPGVDFNRETGRGHPFLYYTNGAAVSEVKIDRFTGDMTVQRVDLLMDAGVPINPGVDRGQITGGFIQGMGWVTNEELRYGAGGELLSHSPTTYKIPNIGDLPPIFNIALLENPHNDISLYNSKALGEPPLLLGISVWAAAKDALSYASRRAIVKLNIPATNENLLMRLTELESETVTAPVPASVAG